MKDPTTASDTDLAAELARLSEGKASAADAFARFQNLTEAAQQRLRELEAEKARQRLRELEAEMAQIEAELRARLNAKHDGLPTPEA